MKEFEWSRREFLTKTGMWAGAGLLQPVLSLVGEGKSIAAAYPDEVLSIEKYTKGKIKPGTVISKENAALVKDLCPEGLYLELTRGAQIKIAETTLKADALVSPYWVQATLTNKGKAMLDKKGQLWTKDGKPWIGGDPFPEANSGIEAMWNHSFNNRRYDDLLVLTTSSDVDTNGSVVRRGATLLVRIQTVGRLAVEPKPVIPQYKDELFEIMLQFTVPFDIYGLASNTTVYYDASRLPETDLYIPALRRTRRVPSTQRFDPVAPYATYFISDLDIHNDPLLTWSWKLAGRKPMLSPSPANLGPRGKGEPFTYANTDEKFPRSTWELRPEVLMVDGVSQLAGSPYSKKRVYVDAIYHRAQYADTWDKAGKLWKWFVFFFGDTGVPDNMGSTARDLTAITFADLQNDFHNNLVFYNKVPGNPDFRVNAGFKIPDWNTPQAMLRRGRR